VRCIYVSTGNSSSICRYLVANGLSGKIKVIATDINDDTVTYMDEGVMRASIYQVPYAQGRVAAKMMFSYISEGAVPRSSIRLPPHIVLRGNVGQSGELITAASLETVSAEGPARERRAGREARKEGLPMA